MKTGRNAVYTVGQGLFIYLLFLKQLCYNFKRSPFLWFRCVIIVATIIKTKGDALEIN